MDVIFRPIQRDEAPSAAEPTPAARMDGAEINPERMFQSRIGGAPFTEPRSLCSKEQLADPFRSSIAKGRTDGDGPLGDLDVALSQLCCS